VPTTAADTVELSGRVEHLRYQSPKFSVGTLITGKGRKTFSVKGYVRSNDHIVLKGAWETHPKYGLQFTADEAVPTTPTDGEGLKIWLAWSVHGVGPVKAGKLVEEFGTELPDRCRTEPEVVAAATGLPLSVIEMIAKEWQEQASKLSEVTELAALGLTRHQVETLVGRFKGTAVTLLRDDPYLLLGNVDGLGWSKIDEIAGKVGIGPTDARRVRAAVEWTVKENKDNGHTCRDAVEVHAEVLERIGVRDAVGVVGEDQINAAAAEAERLKKIKIIAGEGFRYYATPASWRHEEFLWKFFEEGRQPNPFTPPGTAGRIAKMYRSVSGPGGKILWLDDGQVSAVELALTHKVVVVTGGAGAGKTLVARAIAKSHSDTDVPVTFAAPTGKAARRLTELTGCQASTIHRLLGLGFDNGMEAEACLPEGLVIIDEFSMVDSGLAFTLCKAAGPKTVLVLIGDDNQLSPVGAGAVLRDVLANGLAPVARLVGCHRQAGILKTNCTAILRGQVEPSAVEKDPAPWLVHKALNTPELIGRAVQKLFEEYLPKWGFDPVSDTQFLTAQHKGRYGTKYLNKVVQRLRQKMVGGIDLPEPDPGDDKKAKPMVGDKVIQTKNNYKLGVMNGHQGIVLATDPVLIVDFEGGDTVVYSPDERGEVEMGYVLTPHKAQGSEWRCVVAIVPQAHWYMQHRNWFYTAATRARETAVIIGDDKGIRDAATKIETDRRVTLLSVFAARKESRP
jgi:exodeoxyribonuclease V alpha subunit